MAKGYWIVLYRKINDLSRIEAYRRLAGPVMQASGGRPLVRGDPAKIHEGGVDQRVVIIEFDSIEQALAVHDSPAYRAAVEALGDGAERDVRFVEGL